MPDLDVHWYSSRVVRSDEGRSQIHDVMIHGGTRASRVDTSASATLCWYSWAEYHYMKYEYSQEVPLMGSLR